MRKQSARAVCSILHFPFSILLLLALPAGAAEWHVSPKGAESNAGTKDSPWDLPSMLEGRQKAAAGDTVWVHGGVYRQADRSPGAALVVKLRGTKDKPIRVRVAPGERATLDGALQIGHRDLRNQAAEYAWIEDLEIIVSEAEKGRVTRQTGSAAGDFPGPYGGLNVHQSVGCKLINLVIHDTIGGATGMWQTAVDAELYGCVIYHTGWNAPDRGHGHGLYAQNHDGVKRVVDNIFYGGFNHGFQIYGSGDNAYVDNFHLEGNIGFMSGALQGGYERNFLIGGGRTCANNVIASNYSYYPPGALRYKKEGGEWAQALNVGYREPGIQKPVVKDNYCVGGVHFVQATDLTLTGNTFIGRLFFEGRCTPAGSLAGYPGNTHVPEGKRPAGVKVFVRPNVYETGRAHVAVFNWDHKDSVDVDLSGALKSGDRFIVMDAQNFYGDPVARGTFDGKPVRIPMNGRTIARPAGIDASKLLESVGPEFGAFVVKKASAGQN